MLDMLMEGMQANGVYFIFYFRHSNDRLSLLPNLSKSSHFPLRI